MIRLWNVEDKLVGERNQGGDSVGVGEVSQEACSEKRETGSDLGLGNSGVHPGKTREEMARVSGENQERVVPQRQWDRFARREGQCGQTPEKPTGMAQKKIHRPQQHRRQWWAWRMVFQ